MSSNQTVEFVVARKLLNTLIKTFDLTTRKFNEEKLRDLKNIVRKNPVLISAFTKEILQCIKSRRFSSRIAVLLICDEFFQRSHIFRLEFLNNLYEYFVHAIEIDPIRQTLLPFTRAESNSLKKEALNFFKIWYEKFGVAYPKLQHFYLKLYSSHSSGLLSVASTEASQSRENEFDRRRREKGKLAIWEVSRAVDENRNHILNTIRECRCALELIVPRFDYVVDDEGTSSSLVDQPVSSSVIAKPLNELHGYLPSDTISVAVLFKAPSVSRSKSNDAVIDSLIDSMKMLTYFQNLNSKWLSKLTKYGCEAEDIVREIIGWRAKLKSLIDKCEELNLPKVSKAYNDSDSESDDLEDVPEKEGLETYFKMPYEVPPYVLAKIEGKDQLFDCKSASGSRKEDSVGDVGGSECSKKPGIPILSYGLDLKYWGENDVAPAEIPQNASGCSAVWGSCEEGHTVKDSAEAYRSRLITFIGSGLSTRQCRTPLKDGSLCPRTEHRKCAIHGLIIERDEFGYPVEEQKVSGATSSSKMEESFLKDLEYSTGLEFRSEKQMKTNKRHVMSEGVELRSRLCTKLFNRRSLKRVSDTLDSMMKAKAAKKFQNQFNYIFQN